MWWSMAGARRVEGRRQGVVSDGVGGRTAIAAFSARREGVARGVSSRSLVSFGLAQRAGVFRRDEVAIGPRCESSRRVIMNHPGGSSATWIGATRSGDGTGRTRGGGVGGWVVAGRPDAAREMLHLTLPAECRPVPPPPPQKPLLSFFGRGRSAKPPPLKKQPDDDDADDDDDDDDDDDELRDGDGVLVDDGLVLPPTCTSPYRRAHAHAMRGLGAALRRTVAIVCWSDVVVNFFTGRINVENGVLEPMPTFKRWVLPGVLLQARALSPSRLSLTLLSPDSPDSFSHNLLGHNQSSSFSLKSSESQPS